MKQKSFSKWSWLISVFLSSFFTNRVIIQVWLLFLHKLIYLNINIFLLVVSLHGRCNKRVSTLEIKNRNNQQETIQNLFATIMNTHKCFLFFVFVFFYFNFFNSTPRPHFTHLYILWLFSICSRVHVFVIFRLWISIYQNGGLDKVIIFLLMKMRGKKYGEFFLNNSLNQK